MVQHPSRETLQIALKSWDFAAVARQLDVATDLRKQFLERFPISSWASMSVEKYALGQPGNQDTACYWLEFKTKAVLVLAGVVQCSRNQVLDHVRQSRRPVGDDLGRVAVDGQGSGEEHARRGDVSALRHVHVDHLPVLVHGPIHVPPDPADLDIGFVDEPAIPGHLPTRPGCVDQQRGKPLHPQVERHVVDLDAALGEQFLQIPVRQPVPGETTVRRASTSRVLVLESRTGRTTRKS